MSTKLTCERGLATAKGLKIIASNNLKIKKKKKGHVKDGLVWVRTGDDATKQPQIHRMERKAADDIDWPLGKFPTHRRQNLTISSICAQSAVRNQQSNLTIQLPIFIDSQFSQKSKGICI